MKTYRTKKLKRLAVALLAVKNEKQILNFLRDLCTLEELEELGSRWQVVELLAQGRPYREIAKLAKVSTATITRIAHWLTHGEGGYRAVLNKLDKGEKKSAK